MVADSPKQKMLYSQQALDGRVACGSVRAARSARAFGSSAARARGRHTAEQGRVASERGDLGAVAIYGAADIRSGRTLPLLPGLVSRGRAHPIGSRFRL